METTLVIKHISNWINDYIENSKLKGFVIGISGGIDSAVTSALAARTSCPLICIEMPIHENLNQSKLAAGHIKWIKKKYSNVRSIKIGLTSVFEEFLSKQSVDEKELLALANTRARLRMTTLYYFAQANNSLVLGTGNKVEDFGVGFYTKYGDGGVDISPIADLLKSEVYSIAKELELNKDIIKAAPTDGLWDQGKTDEDQIGATYPELEWAMSFEGEHDRLSSREKKVIQIYTKLNKENKHKMLEIPVCIIPKKLR